MSSPSIAGTLGVGVKLASTPQTLSTKNYDAYTTGGIFNGVFYAARAAFGTCGGIVSTGPNPVTLPLAWPALPVNISQVPLTYLIGTKNPSQGGSALSNVVGSGACPNTNPIVSVGSHLPRAFIFTDNSTARVMWTTDANYGLLYVPRCTFPGTYGVGIVCDGNSSGFPPGSYATRPPGAPPKMAGVMGVAAVMVGGVQMIAVTQQTALWL